MNFMRNIYFALLISEIKQREQSPHWLIFVVAPSTLSPFEYLRSLTATFSKARKIYKRIKL